MTGLPDLHFDYQAHRILTAIEESSHIKHLEKGLLKTRKAKIASLETLAAMNIFNSDRGSLQAIRWQCSCERVG